MADADPVLKGDPTPREQRKIDAVCSGNIHNEHEKLLWRLKSFVREHDTEPDDDASNRFVIGIMRMLESGRLVLEKHPTCTGALLARFGSVAF